MAITYFGITSPGVNQAGWGGNSLFWNNNYTTGFTCPGSGSQDVKELHAHLYQSSGAGNVLVGLYDTGENLVCEGSAEVAIGSSDWYGHTAFSPGFPTITGGTGYILAAAIDDSNTHISYDGGSSGDYQYDWADHTAGLPDPLPGGSDYGNLITIRCGVEPTAGGLSIPIAMHHQKMQGQ